MKTTAAALLLCCALAATAQNRNSVWCFGDSAGIDFSSGVPIPINTSLDSRGSCASISDTSGNLLFYTAYDPTVLISGTDPVKAYNFNHVVMLNGDSMKGGGWYNEIIIIPYPGAFSFYYIFYLGVTFDYGLYYSILDMNANGGLGAIVQKNIQLQTFAQVDCLNAIKHGNGRDWWIIFRKSDVPNGSSNNDWYTYLINPDSVQNFSIQSIGSLNRTDLGQISFSPIGDKIVFSNLTGLVELFDFDRCTGLLSNPVTVEPDAGTPPYPFNWSCAFSPDESKLYVTANADTSFLYQYNLNAPNITASKVTLWSLNYPSNACGELKLAPDNKIYLSNWYNNGIIFPYPYPDSIYNMYNMNLSVINQPDSLDAACDFQPYSFYLGGKRTYLGLPNNPDYELGALAGSPCDSLTGVASSQYQVSRPELFVFYHSRWQKLFVNAQHLKGKKCELNIYGITGKEVYHSTGAAQGGYFTQDINLSHLSNNLYLVSLQTEQEKLVKKFVKE